MNRQSYQMQIFYAALIVLSFIQPTSFANAQILEIATSANFYVHKEHSAISNKVTLLYVSAPQCPYCKKLEQEILLPMLKSGDYQQRLKLVKINRLSTKDVLGFSGKKQPIKEFLSPYNIKFTPTLLFLDPSGRQVHQAFIGYQSNEFYWYYFDRAIEQANQLISEK